MEIPERIEESDRIDLDIGINVIDALDDGIPVFRKGSQSAHQTLQISRSCCRENTKQF